MLVGSMALVISSIVLVIGSSHQPTRASGSVGFAPQHSMSRRTARCSEAVSGGGSITWTAGYESMPARHAGARLRVTALRADRSTESAAAGAWTLWWVEPNGLVGSVSASSTNLARLQAPTDKAVLLPPSADCALVLTSSPPGRSIAVIGDSIFSGIDTGVSSGRLAPSTFDRRLLVTAETGYGWSASAPTWPLNTVGGRWAVGLERGLLSYEPSCLVAELGANDALRATFGDALMQPRPAADIRRAVAGNVEEILAIAASRSVPIVLVTIPEYPVKTYGAGVYFTNEAKLMNASLRALAAASPGTVVIADWSTLSAHHHVASKTGKVWFLGDDLHPNTAGDEALLNLVQQTTSRIGC
jgi:hypothetical protein